MPAAERHHLGPSTGVLHQAGAATLSPWGPTSLSTATGAHCTQQGTCLCPCLGPGAAIHPTSAAGEGPEANRPAKLLWGSLELVHDPHAAAGDRAKHRGGKPKQSFATGRPTASLSTFALGGCTEQKIWIYSRHALGADFQRAEELKNCLDE